MKTILSLLVFWCGLISAPAASGEVPEALPDLDRRAEHAATAGALAPAFSNTARAAREEKTRSLGEQFPRLHIATDPVTKAAKWVAASDRFLSGPKGAGGAVGNAAAALPVDDPHRAVKAFLNEYRGLFGHDAALLADTQILRDDTTPRSGLRTTVWQQFVDGIPIFEGMLKASLGKGGELVNVGSQLVAAPALAADLGTPDRAVVQRSPRVAARQAVVLAARNVDRELDSDAVTPTEEPEGARLLQHFAAPGLLEPRATLVWLPMNELAMRLCWSVILTSKARGEMFRVVVDAETGEIQIRQGLTNYLSDASYRVFTSDSPSPMSPGPAVPGSTQPAVVARPLVTTPALNTTASPNGWIDDGVNETRGNNVDAHLDLNADNIADTPRPQGAAGRVFDFALDLTQAPATYRNAAVTNLFYWCNRIHDRFYELGFTEAAGNFQNNTFGRGGVGNDAVQADAQDGSGTNNANFSTPPDGAAGRMQMYVFTGPTPDRDGDFDHEIVIHEYTHGLSNRLVGGGVGISALQPRGMGEGWSDFYGLCLLSEAGDDVDGNYAAGGYATYQLTAGFDQNYYYGIRRYPYTTDLAKNPLTFKDIDPAQASAHTGVPRSPAIGNTANEVHNMGEVWCVALWDARANLIRKVGFALGNELILQLVTDGMKLAPANPTFLQARDAILQAELVGTGGAHRGELWAAFAKRGMGSNATSPVNSTTAGLVENYDLPDDLSVTPAAGFTARGAAGGPFSVTSTACTLRNTGTASLNWTASSNAAWLTLASSAGTLAGSATATVTVSLHAAANALANGVYTGTVTVVNTTSGLAQARLFTLRVGVVDYFTELFDTSVNDTAFQSFTFTPNGSANFYRATRATAAAFSTDPAGGTPLAGHDTFNVITLTGGATVPFYGTSYGTLYVGSNGYVTFDSGDGGLTASVAAHFARKRIAGLMGHLNGNATAVSWRQLADRVAVTWLNVPEYSVVNSNSFQIEMFFDGRVRITTLGIGATGGLIGLSKGGGTPADFTESDFTSYGMDAFLTLTAPAQATEGAGTLANAGQVTATPAPAANLTVTLASNRPADVTVPPTVTILAGQTSAQFPLTIGDNALLDGSRTAVLSASAAAFAAAQRPVIVNDDETGVLTVSAPVSATEGGPNLQGTVTVNTAVGADVFVALSSGNPAEVQVPVGVTIVAGQTSAVFPITMIDDLRLDGAMATTITAQVTNWTPGSATINVLDNETASLTISAPAALREGDTAQTGTVRIGGSIATPLVVALSSNDPTEITVPATVTIPAGQTQAVFAITVIDDSADDGAQSVTLSATAAGFTGSPVVVSVADNDAHHFAMTPIANPVLRHEPVAVSVSARDVNGAIITNYNQTVAFTTNPASVPVTPASATGFVNGVLAVNLTFTAYGSGVVLAVADTGLHAGTSNAFDVTFGPAARFVWSPIASPRFVDELFPVTIRAVDAAGNSVPTFTGTASLAAPLPSKVEILTWTAYADISAAGEYVRTKQAISTFNTNYNETATNVTDAATLTTLLAGKHVFLIVEQEASSATTLGTIGTAWSAVLNSFVSSGGTVIVCSNTTSEHLLLTNSGLLNVTPIGSPNSVAVTKPADTPLNAGVAVPFTGSFLHSYSTTNGVVSLQTGKDPVVISRDVGAGRVVLIGTDFNALGTGMDRVIANAVGLAQPLGGGALPVNPSGTGAFVAGEWTGSVSVPYTGAGIVLRATAGALSGDSNALTVSAALPPSTLGTVFVEDFESGILNPAYWTITGTGGFRTINSAANGPHGGLRHMTMDEATDSGTYARNEATLAVNLAGRTGVLLKFWAIGYSEEADGPPPAPFPSTGANFDGVAISADGGVNWYEVQPLRTLSAAYAPYTVDLDAALAARGLTYGNNFKIRFNQYDNYAIATDGIGIDDILITAAPLTGFVITAPAQVTEGAGAVGAVVTLNVAAATDTIIALTSSAPAKITVPASVQVPAGQTTASFTFMVLDDGIADGNRAVAITGSLAGQLPRAATVTVLDNDPLPLSIAAPATVAEGATGQTGTVTLGAAASGVITINLSSSDTTAVQVPASITLPAGQQSVAFPLTVVDDTRIDGAQLATLSASVPGWMDATTTVQVTDNETRTLALSGPYSVYEGATTSASVSISGTLPTDLVVTLTSANPAQLTVPASITIPAGLTSATFLATGVDDPLQDGTQTVVVTASAATFTSTTVSTTVYDNEVHHFTFTTVASSIVRGQPLTVTVSARDVNNATISVFTGSVNLAAAAGGTSVPMTPALSGSFSSGSWSGSVTIAGYGTGVAITASDAAGHTGTSNSFTVGAGALTALVWGTVPSPVTPGAPFATTLQARDAFGNTVPSFNGPVAVAAGPAQRTVGTGAVTVTQVLYTSASEARTQCIYLASELGAAGRLTGLALDVTALPGLPLTRFTVRVRPTALAAYASGAVWESTSWTTVFQANVTVSHTGWVMLPFSTPFAYDGTSNLMVDFSFDNVGSGTSGIVRASPATTTRMLYGSAFGASGDPLTWSGITPTVSLSSYLPNLRLRIERAVPITPATVTLASGAWTGALSLGGAGTGLTLTADATTGLTGESSAFDAVAAAALIVTPAGPASTSGFRGGPFTPLTHTFTVSNGGSGTMAWTASTATPWMSLSPGGGSLGAGASIAVTATLNAAALNALASGTHDGVIAFTNTTSGLGNTARTVTVSAVPAGDLVVTPPAALDASGPVGGPFAPSSQTYTLTNAGDVALNWTAGQTASWLTLSSAAGTLAPRASTTVTATILAPALKPGGYSDAVTFTNTSNHRGDTTRTATLNVILPAPILAFEPVFTGGTANSVTWSAVSAASEYEAEAADDVAFTSPVRSGWIAATSYTFTGLEDGRRYHYRVRARRVVPEQVGAWTQITQAEFDTGTKTGTVTVAPGSVVIGSALTWTENFDEPGTSFSSTIFSDIISSWNRLALSTSTYPATLPAIPINQGGDLEATGLGGAFMTDLPANRFTDGVIEGYLFPTQVNTFVALQLRAQRSPLQSYAAGISRDSATSGRVQIFVWGFGNVFGASPSFLMNGPNENFKLRFVASGSTLTVSLWRVAVSGGSVLETPVILENGVNSIVRTGASQTAGVAGIYALSAAGGTDLSACDDVAISVGGGGVYAASGTLTSQAIAPVPWQRWGALSFTSDTSAPGTALTVDVLNASGALLAANVAAGTDLSGIAAVASQASIRLRADLSTSNSANSPRLDGWSVTYATAPAQTTLSGWSETAVSAQDATAPAVTMTSPWATSTVLHTLAGTADDAGSISGVAGLTVNGVPVVSGDAFAHWSLPVTLTLGVNTFSIVVWDKASPANERTFSHTVSVTPAAGDADGDGLPDAWEALYGLNTKDAKGANGALGDPDGDGRCTLLELALGTNPSVPDADGGNPPVLVRDAGDGQTYLTWRYRRLIAPGALSYIVETCTDFSEWHSGSAWIEEVGVPAPNPDGLTESVTIRALPPISSGPGYLRLRVTAP